MPLTIVTIFAGHFISLAGIFFIWRLVLREPSESTTSHTISSASKMSDKFELLFTFLWYLMVEAAAVLVLLLSIPSTFWTIWPFVNRQSHNKEQLQTNGFPAKLSLCRRSKGKCAASKPFKLLRHIETSIKSGLPWNNFSGSSENLRLSSSVIFSRHVLSMKAL